MTCVNSVSSIADRPTARRRERLRAATRDAGLDALLVTDLVNVRYLSGFTGSNAALLVSAAGPDGDRIATDGRYLVQVAQQAGDLPLTVARDCGQALLRDVGPTRVGFEAEHVSVAAHTVLAEVAELVPTTGLVETLREVKEPAEVDALGRACAVADEALRVIVERGAIAPGATERDVQRALDFTMLELGADAVSFETIVATGSNSAIPHHRPTGAVLAAGDFVKIDFGAVVDGYHSDMTRTFVLGSPAPWQTEIYELVATAQAAGRAALAPGTELAAIDAAARDVIDAAGHGEHYVHGLGHGVGLLIHEAPGIGAAATGRLLAGAVVTVEPGVYLPGRGGVRIEDTLVVTDGEPELLTLFDKALLVL